MSVYGHLCCIDCKVSLWLGKAINWRTDDSGPKSFAREDAPDGLNWKSEALNQVLWKLLAQHCGHSIRVLLEQEFDTLLGKDDYRMIGGDRDLDIRFEDCLREN